MSKLLRPYSLLFILCLSQIAPLSPSSHILCITACVHLLMPYLLFDSPPLSYKIGLSFSLITQCLLSFYRNLFKLKKKFNQFFHPTPLSLATTNLFSVSYGLNKYMGLTHTRVCVCVCVCVYTHRYTCIIPHTRDAMQ